VFNHLTYSLCLGRTFILENVPKNHSEAYTLAEF
jgi:hypothetical protein